MDLQNTELSVIVIADRNFGSGLDDVARSHHTWIIDTPINRSAVEGIWRLREFGPVKTLTLFNDQRSISLDELVATMIGTVEEHHPGLNRIDIRGVAFTPLLEQALGAYRFGGATFHRDGFVVTR